MPETLIVNEIFHSIQGESTHAGLPCVFVRLTGCKLRCTWCDTDYAFSEGVAMNLDDIITEVRAYACPLVEITGGEPLLQPNALPLFQRLCDLGLTVLLETSGTEDIANVDPRVIKIMDLKCPSSGESNKNRYANLRHITAKDELKFVLADRADYDWAKSQLAEHDLAKRCSVLFSPVWDKLPLKTLAEWILADRLSVRLQTQWQKHIWGPDARGV
ncbi:MAG: 7-carboxy-7-deazaguanine synthase QueE [Verrucomicrobia bacterium]|nr:7-carboxy-7-deazaguanine synthase QueE [Verrucomicrobiota bacterium]